MKLVYKQILWGLAGILIILSFACKAVSFGQPDIEETSQAEIDATKSTGIDSPDDVIPTAKSGEIIAAGEIEIFIPPETQEKQPLITAKPINEALPPAPDESTAIGQAYEITSEDELTGSVLISISYEPSDLPPGANEENLYIATLVGEEWQVVPDGFVDTENHTVNASVEHFSFFGIFQSATEIVYDAVQAAVGDEITSEYFSDLPDAIRYDFYNLHIKPQDVTAIVHAKLSLATKAASGIISFGNLVSKTAGLAIGAIENTEELVWAMGELIFAEVGDRATDSQAGSFIVAAYDSFDLGREIGKYVYELKDANPGKAAAMASAWILAQEMEYINANMNPALEGLWTFNPFSVSRLDVYAVYFDAVPWQEETGYGASGVKFYYYNNSDEEWVNYYNDVFVWKMTFEPEEIIEATDQPHETDEATQTATSTATSTPTRTSTPRPTHTPLPTNTPVPASINYGDTEWGYLQYGEYDLWKFYGEEGDRITITMLSGNQELDPYLYLESEDGSILIENDDASLPNRWNYDAQIEDYTLPFSGIYNIRAKSRSDDGDYELSLELVKILPMTGIWHITTHVTEMDEVGGHDCDKMWVGQYSEWEMELVQDEDGSITGSTSNDSGFCYVDVSGRISGNHFTLTFEFPNDCCAGLIQEMEGTLDGNTFSGQSRTIQYPIGNSGCCFTTGEETGWKDE